jgi:hypothetical protein
LGANQRYEEKQRISISHFFFYILPFCSIYQAGVQYILDSVIPELEKDPLKTFVYVEIAFFERWWSQQDAAMQSRVKVLVQNTQLTFVGGGWCMNDESGVSDEAIITQVNICLCVFFFF